MHQHQNNNNLPQQMQMEINTTMLNKPKEILIQQQLQANISLNSVERVIFSRNNHQTTNKVQHKIRIHMVKILILME